MKNTPQSPNWTLFLDRDGVLNERVKGGYVKRPDELQVLPGVPEMLAKVRPLFTRIVVVTNQQGIGKGLMTEKDLQRVHDRLAKELARAEVSLDAIYFCPELAKNEPECRKPNTGMALQAQKQFPEIEFSRSLMVGDTASDIIFGKRAGMRTLWVGPEAQNQGPVPDQRAVSLAAALPWVVSLVKKDLHM